MRLLRLLPALEIGQQLFGRHQCDMQIRQERTAAIAPGATLQHQVAGRRDRIAVRARGNAYAQGGQGLVQVGRRQLGFRPSLDRLVAVEQVHDLLKRYVPGRWL